MKLPLSWINEFVTISASPEELAEILTMAGIEVDHIHKEPDDVILDISLTPNLVHCMSVLGIARELSALTNTPLKMPSTYLEEDPSILIEDEIDVVIKNQEACPRYACRVIKDVTVGPSPAWLIKRLAQCGMRSINNIVDATNYVLLQYGHPLHAFDLQLLKDNKIIVDNASAGAFFTTLDGVERVLTKNMLMINDAEQPVALAGVMGGQSSEISSKTSSILLESAYFHPASVRKTSKQLGLSTEGSKRFERGADPDQALISLNIAAALIQQLAGGNIATGFFDIKTRNFHPKTITCRLSRINQLLGTSLSFGEVEDILRRLQCPLTFEGQEVMHVRVPTYRGDITHEIDLVEEVARVYGYNNIPKSQARHATSTMPHAPAFIFETNVRSRLLSLGLQEILTCNLIGPKDIALLSEDYVPKEGIIHVLNHSSIEQSALRPSLFPGLLQVVKHNLNHQTQDITGFEVGRVHFKYNNEYKEHPRAGIILCGKQGPHYWKEKPKEYDFFDLKGIVEDFLDSLSTITPTFKASSLTLLHPGRQASIFIGKELCGVLGEVHPSILRSLDIPHRVFFAELDLQDLYRSDRKEGLMQPLPQFPASERDWTVTLPEDTNFSFIETIQSPILEKVSLVSIYVSDKLGSGLKNLTFRFVYRDAARTLSFEEVEQEHARILKSLGNL